ncbi:hypothetical protein LEP1GSC072_0056 [Leptospira noguchii str. Bonito]|nr:hypothetical protein LEP1GSC072_0056 [Leptospira noguchii str. Bonito]
MLFLFVFYRIFFLNFAFVFVYLSTLVHFIFLMQIQLRRVRSEQKEFTSAKPEGPNH